MVKLLRIAQSVISDHPDIHLNVDSKHPRNRVDRLRRFAYRTSMDSPPHQTRNNRTFLLVLGIASMLAWIMLFSAGLLIDSEPYRTALINKDVTVHNLVLAALLYTPTNVALLSMLAGLMGGCSSLMYDHGDLEEQIKSAQAEGNQQLARRLTLRLSYLSESPFSSMLRGFLVYLAIISGILLAISNPFEVTSADQFIRLAGLFSVIAFVMGYDPTRFEDLIDTLSSLSHKAAGKK